MTTDSASPTVAPPCPNCGADAVGRYCPACGQDNARPRLRARDWLVEAGESFANLDGKVLRTIRGLTFDPGGTARRYVDGRRASYVTPVRYALGACALWWAVVAVQLAAQEPLLVAAASRSAAHARQVDAVRTMSKYGQLLNLLFVPFLAPVLSLAFLGFRRSYVEHLCLTLFVCGHVFLWRAGLAYAGGRFPAAGPALNLADLIAFALYLGWALFVFHRGDGRFLWARVAAAVAGVFAASELLNVVARRVLL